MDRFLGVVDKPSRKILYACFFAFFFNGMITLTMGSVMPDLKLAYGLTDTQSGLMISGHSAGNLLAGLFSSLVPLYFGKRRSIAGLVLLSSVGFAITMITGSPVLLVAAFVLIGIGRGSVSNFNNATVNQVSKGNPAASNLLHSFFAIGAFSAPTIFLISSRIAGWRFSLSLLIAVGIGVSINFLRQRFPDDKPDRKDKTQSSVVFLKNYSYLIAAGMMFFYLCAEYSINGWLVTYLQNKPAVTQAFSTAADGVAALKTYSQTMATLLWVVILAGRLTCAMLSKRIAQKRLLAYSSVGSVLFFAMLLLGQEIWQVTMAIVGLGFCMSGISPMIYSDASYITNVYPMGTSIILAIGSSGAIIMPSVVGMMADTYGFAGGMACIMVAIVLLLVLSIVNLVVRPKPIDPVR